MKVPEDTTKRDPMLFLAMALVGGNSFAIEHQEAQGQRDFIHSESLPSDMRDGCRAALESLGAAFGEIDPADPMFIPCTLPKGWTKKRTDHSMWSELIDDKGRKRGAIFYKAAFYDRSAHMHMECRYGCRRDYEVTDGAVYFITDGGKEIHRFEAVPYGNEARHKTDIEAEKIADTYLTENFPDWWNPAAHWD